MQAAADGLRRLVLTLEQLRHRYGELAGVGETDLMALGNLAARGPMGAAELATRLGVSRSSVTALIDRLEAADLVARHPDPTDRRRLRLVVTGHGEDVIGKIRSFSLEMLRDIDAEHLPVIAQGLDEVTAALDRQNPPKVT